jgi:chromosome segregation ATPase
MAYTSETPVAHSYDTHAMYLNMLEKKIKDKSEYIKETENLIRTEENNILGYKRDINDEITQLQEEIKNNDLKIEEKEKNINYLKERIDRLEKSTNELKRHIDGLEKNMNELKRDIPEIEEDIDGLEGDISEIEGDIDGVKRDISEIEGDISEIEGDIDGVKRDIPENVLVQLKKKMIEINKIKKNINKKKQKLTWLKKNGGKLIEIKKIEQEIELLEASIYKIEDEIDDKVQKNASKFKDIYNEIDTIEDEIEKEENKDKLKLKIKEKEENKDKLKLKIKENKDKLKLKIKEIEENKDILKLQIKENEREIKKHTEEIKKHEKEIQNTIQKNSDIIVKITELTHINNTVNPTKIDDCKKMIRIFHRDLTKQKKELKELEKELNENTTKTVPVHPFVGVTPEIPIKRVRVFSETPRISGISSRITPIRMSFEKEGMLFPTPKIGRKKIKSRRPSGRRVKSANPRKTEKIRINKPTYTF